MRLLNTSTTVVTQFGDNDIPPYAILAHTWGRDEVTFQHIQDLEMTRCATTEGYEKVRNCCAVARADGYEYVWIDTCCIDKTSSAELSEAINSMYHWYQEAKVCYAYLADVTSNIVDTASSRKNSNSPVIRWFTRGWTLQELIAPSEMIFLNQKWQIIGTKSGLQQDISEITGIPVGILSGDDDLEEYSVAQRMSWAAKRETSRTEDRAYCLMGIFGINMPLIYGERETAFIRLQEEIMKISDDHSLFAWRSPDYRGGLLATSPAAFIGSDRIAQFNPFNTTNSPLTVSSKGIHLEVPFIGIGQHGLGFAILHCEDKEGKDQPLAIYLRDIFLTMELFERVRSEEFKMLNLRDFSPSKYPVRRICIQKGRLSRIRKSKGFGKYDTIAPKNIYTRGILQISMHSDEQTTLSRAAESGDAEVVWLLLTRSNVVANMGDEHGRTPLWHAVSLGHEVVVKMLLARSDIAADLGGRYGQTLLLLAAQRGHDTITKLLLRSGKIDADSEDNCGRTPLFYAAEYGHDAFAKLLFESRNVRADSKDEHGRTPLSYAAENGHEAILNRLLRLPSVDADSKDSYGWTPFTYAFTKEHEVVAKQLVETGRVDFVVEGRGGRMPLSRRADIKLVAFAKWLLESRKIDADTKNKFGLALLSFAIQDERDTVIKILVDSGKVDLNLRDKYGWTLLLDAAAYGREAATAMLLNSGKVDVTLTNRGLTPLTLAIRNGYIAVVKLLLEFSAVDVDQTDIYGRTPLFYAIEEGHEAIVRLLFKSGNVKINSKDNAGRTPLFFAAKNGHETLLKLLFAEKKVGPNSQDYYGSTPLSIATRNGQEEAVKLLLALENIEIDSKDRFGRTPLWWAMRIRNSQIVELLLKKAEENGISLYEVDVPAKSEQGSWYAMRNLMYYCDVCMLDLPTHNLCYECRDCNGGDFTICPECLETGANCLVDSHNLVKIE